MKTSVRYVGIALVMMLLMGPLPISTSVNQGTRPVPRSPALGSVEGLQTTYQAWRENQGMSERPWTFIIPVGWSRGLSSAYTQASGEAQIDLASGLVSVELGGFPAGSSWDFWLVDNQEGPGRSVRPEREDKILWAGTLTQHDELARLLTEIGDLSNGGFQIDLVVVTPSGQDPTTAGVLFGTPSLFQRLAMREWSAYARAAVRQTQGDEGLFPTLLASLLPAPAYATRAADELAELVAQGEELFFNETFAGNGRTCGTCHPAENNFVIDVPFIATLPPRDPLFVAEFVPALAENFEKPALMHQFGLILENLDGFDDLENKFVMRGVPHVLSMSQSLTPAPGGADGSTVPPNHRTGWSGDGSPGSGTLREFAIGAVVQHFPMTLGRVPGVDFRLPTDQELDALEAFQLSLGRQEDPDLSTLTLSGPLPRRGQEIFLTSDTQGGMVVAGKCNLCHNNAGANNAAGANFNFNTGVEAFPRPFPGPAPFVVPPDGGFGKEPHPTIPGAFGNGTFNTPPLVEAADTGPFFHNNILETIEEAVDFFNSQAFNDSPSGRFLASIDSGGIGIRLSQEEVQAVAAFLRVLNALENIRLSIEMTERLRPGGEADQVRRVLEISLAELEDAIQVLEGAGLHPEAVSKLRMASSFEALALSQLVDGIANPQTELTAFLIVEANKAKRAARGLMVEVR